MTPLLARWLVLMIPSTLVLLLLGHHRRPLERKHAGALLLGFLWSSFGTYFVLRLGVSADWWAFRVDGGEAWGVPLDVCLAAGAMWGVAPPLLSGRLRSTLVLYVASLLMLALATPIFTYSAGAILGAVLALFAVFLPSQALAACTRESTFLPLRMVGQMVLFGVLALVVLPGAALAHGSGSLAFFAGASLGSNSLLLTIAWVLTLSAGAVHDFVALGGGTPLPLDPPRRLVTGGLYAYVANPMQLFMTVALLMLAAGLGSAYLAAGACTATVFSMGVAKWEEQTSLVARFGAQWTNYRTHVRMWLPRWRPYSAERAVYVYLRDCAICEGTVMWLKARAPEGLDFVALQDTNLEVERATYIRGEHVASGVAAIGRALEHIHLGWALFGCMMRLPILANVLQLFADAMGGAPAPPESALANARPTAKREHP